MNPYKNDKSFLEPIDFSSVNETSLAFADYLTAHFEEIADILLEYESFEVVKDEFNRTIDLFRNLYENKDYFILRVNDITAFLPRNQPLYAFSCFVAVPSLMAREVHFRIPHSMRGFFSKLLQTLKIKEFFPNIIISKKERLEFLKERSALLMDPKNTNSLPITDAVVFTGTPHHAERLRSIFDTRTLFIANGAGHNPVIVSIDADIQKTVEATLKLQLYNQGQDCAAPNAILVYQNVYQPFLHSLRAELAKVKIGPYRDRSCRVGPISDPEDLKRIGGFIVDNQVWLDPSTKGVIRTAETIVEPTIICKPLKEGGNYSEIFAPIIFVQKYEKDADLALYFENQQYARNAMYVTLYGDSKYIRNLIGKKIGGKILHHKETFLHNTHLHAPGVERGTQPYGGYGYGASSISINGKIMPKPTCPQRDIYEHLVKPLIKSEKIKEYKDRLSRLTKKVTKNIPKLMGLKLNTPAVQKEINTGKSYLDFLSIKKIGRRYVELSAKQMFLLREHADSELIARLEMEDKKQIQILRKFLMNRKRIDLGEFTTFLYSISKKPGLSAAGNRHRQLHFFHNIYQLLFGKKSGPRLAQFLLDTDRQKICELLDV
ncbi:MAG: aldehyde dehydrogenase family protein [Patescibacteria group bacterium]